MKTTSLQLLGVCVSLLALVSCQRDLKDLPLPKTADAVESQNTGRNETMSVNAVQGTYNVELIYANYLIAPGQYKWVWKVTNTNPGNGNGGTMQDLSHWDFSPSAGTCFNIANVVSAAYSSNNSTWTSFAPSIHPDPSLSCFSGPVFKFDFGTSGSNSSYYRLILNSPAGVGTANGYFKSGKKTGCRLIEFQGINCTGDPTVINNGTPIFQ